MKATANSKVVRTIILTALLVMTQMQQTFAASADSCTLIKVEAERLPDLNIPRAGHQQFCAGDELVVAGGHTNGFVPTPTAEYYKDGEWHTVPMVYNHDFGYSVVLASGKVLIGGGSSEPLGIGQTFLAEMYDPLTHRFEASSCMEQKRTIASALELDNGQVVISGNWYQDDGIEVFDGRRQFTYVKDAAVGRSGPFIFQTAKDDVLIFSGFDTKGDTLHSSMADRLKGAPVNIPLFETWTPFCCWIHRCAESFIGDAPKGRYAYLLAVRDSTGQVAIAKIDNGNVSLLPTTCPVPMTSEWGAIEYYSTVIADQARGVAYLMGGNADFRVHPEAGCRHYVLRIDYAEAAQSWGQAPGAKPSEPVPVAALTLFYTDPIQDVPDGSAPVLTPEGNLLIAGGLTTALSNFAPSGHVYLLRLQPEQKTEGASSHWWWIVWTFIAALVLCATVYLLRRRFQKAKLTDVPALASDKTVLMKTDDATADLMRRINELMEQKKLFLYSELKVADIADAFGVHRNDISACINSQMGCTFAQYVNRYRICHAQQLMRQQPDKKISAVWMESGFGSEQTFFKTFRAATGLSPKEWIQQEND